MWKGESDDTMTAGGVGGTSEKGRVCETDKERERENQREVETVGREEE